MPITKGINSIDSLGNLFVIGLIDGSVSLYEY